MLDWLTLRLPRERVPSSTLHRVEAMSGRITKTDSDGVIEWCIPARESIRSDSHQVTVHLGAHHLEVAGSPARVLCKDNVFGSGDIVVCWSAMVRFVTSRVGALPLDVSAWGVSRVDVTHNYALNNLAEVRQALGYLRHAEGGRYQLRTSADTVYWSPSSRVRSGKAYAKGPHLERQVAEGKAVVEPWQLEAAQRLLRLELSLRSKWWRREHRKWWEFTENDFDRVHAEYFGRVVGKVEVPEMESDLLKRCEEVAPSRGQGRAAYRTWVTIQRLGEHNVRATMSRATWMRHRKILFAAGLTFADLNAGTVVPLRRRTIVLEEPVRSWEELRRVA